MKKRQFARLITAVFFFYCLNLLAQSGAQQGQPSFPDSKKMAATSLTYKVIETAGKTYGYDIFSNTKLMIHQPSVPGLEHHLWLHDGRLRLTLQDQAHELLPGDSLSYQLWGSSRFEVPGPEGARYTLAICNPLPAGAA